MRAWLFTGAHNPLELIQREDPRPEAGQAVVKVLAAGLCHSDVGVLEGTLAPMAPPPLVLGHEIAGEIAILGADVVGFEVGDRVVVRGGPGWTGDGGYATYCLTSAEVLLRLPSTVSLEQGAVATDAGATSYGAVMRSGELQAGQRVGIIGLGGLGMAGARIAVLNGAEVFAAEPRREVWGLAKEQGVKEVVNDVVDLAPYTLDLIVDFAGFGSTTAGAITAIRRGGLIVQVGLGSNEMTISASALVERSVTLRGHSMGGGNGILEGVIEHMATGDLTIKTTSVRFEEIPDALKRLAEGGVSGRLVATFDTD